MRYPSSTDQQGRSIWRDVRSGMAGWPLRVALSVATALINAACAMFALWAVAAAFNFGRIRDEHIFAALAFGGGLWALTLYAIWASFPSYRLTIRASFGTLAIWAVTVPVCIAINELVRRNEEVLIAAVIFSAAAINVYWITSAGYRGPTGRALVNADGQVNIICPNCGYSMIGLGEARCPECGVAYTLDELVHLQRYEALAETRMPPHEIVSAILEQSTGPDAPVTSPAPEQPDGSMNDASGECDMPPGRALEAR